MMLTLKTTDVGVDDATHISDYVKESEFIGGTIGKIVLRIKPAVSQLNKSKT
jgi:hypothetical protein